MGGYVAGFIEGMVLRKGDLFLNTPVSGVWALDTSVDGIWRLRGPSTASLSGICLHAVGVCFTRA